MRSWIRTLSTTLNVLMLPITVNSDVNDTDISGIFLDSVGG